MSYDIFISYRRDGGDTLAQLVYDRLTDRGYKVFLDIESLRSGKFNEKLLDVIDECKDVVLILPPNALERCKNPNDWLYLEASHSIKGKKNIIPLMMRGFTWPEELPAGLEELSNFNGIQDSKDYFDAVIDKLTLLLQSKPSMFGNVKKQAQKTKRPVDIKAKKAKLGKILFSVLLIVLAIAGALVFGFYKHKNNLEVQANMVHITLTAPEEMSASLYYEALDILEKRIEILAGDEMYEFKVEDDQILISVPVQVFGDKTIEQILRCYISRPVQLYLRTKNEDTDFIVERSDIEKLERKQGVINGIDPVEFEVDGLESYVYFSITFSDRVTQLIEDNFDESSGTLYLTQDKVDNQDLYYYYPLAQGENGEYYFVDNIQNDNINNLVEYNLSNETFPKAFTFRILYPVDWENTKSISDKGAYQCNVDELNGNLITIQYETYMEEMTAGELQDAVAVFKERMDALGMPYAFGYTKSGNYNFSIKTGVERQGASIINLIGMENPLKLVTDFYYFPSIEKDTVRYGVDEQGQYYVSASLPSYETERYQEIAAEMLDSENTTIYLSYDGFHIAKCDIRENPPQIVDNCVTIYFDNLCGWEVDEIKEEHIFLMDFLAALDSKILLPDNYYLDQYRFSDSNLTGEDLGVITDDYEEEKAYYSQIVKGICPTADVVIVDNKLRVNLNMEWTDTSLKEFVEAVKAVYQQCDLDNGKYTGYISCRSDQESDVIFYYSADKYEKHCIDYTVGYYGELMEDYKEEAKRLFEEDSFFTETVAPGSDNWFTDDNWLWN